jgi:hypothetical protein
LANPYLAGFVPLVAVAAIYHLVLKRLVFRAPPA